MTELEIVFTQQARHVFAYLGIDFDDIISQRMDLLRRGKVPTKIILPNRKLFGCELEFSPYVSSCVVVDEGLVAEVQREMDTTL